MANPFDLNTWLAGGTGNLSQDQREQTSLMGRLAMAKAFADSAASQRTDAPQSIMQMLTGGVSAFGQGANANVDNIRQMYLRQAQEDDIRRKQKQQQEMDAFLSSNSGSLAEKIGAPSGMPISQDLVNAYITKQMNKDPFDDALKQAQANYYNKKTSEAGDPDAGGGQVWFLARKLMNDNPNLNPTQAIQLAMTGFRQGTQLDASGNVVPMGGAINAKAMEAQAKAEGRAIGDKIGESNIGAGNVYAKGEQAMATIDRLANSKGFDAIFGKSGVIPNMPGGDAADAQALLDEVLSKNYLQGIEAFKGTGALSEAEGKVAQAAIINLGQAQSAEQARVQVMILQDIIRNGMMRTAQMSSRGIISPITPAPATLGGAVNTTKPDPLGLRK